ncbi:MAG: ABC transporter permease, partial [Myxococcota bacterium]
STMFMDIDSAQSLLDLAGRVTRIEMQVADVFEAPAVSRRLAAATGLEATTWIDEAENLEEALRAQARTGELVKAFSLLVVVVGVASALLLAATRRRSEVAIVRSMGFSKSTVMHIFICQGVFIGLAGALIGSAMGWLFGTMLVELTTGPEGPSLPVDPAQGEYLTAVLLAVGACTLAAILPARSAAGVDPVQVLSQ